MMDDIGLRLLELRQRWRSHEHGQLVFVDALARHYGVPGGGDRLINRHIITHSAARELITLLVKAECGGDLPALRLPDASRAAQRIIALRTTRTSLRNQKLDGERRGAVLAYITERIALLRELMVILQLIGHPPSAGLQKEIAYWQQLTDALLMAA